MQREWGCVEFPQASGCHFCHYWWVGSKNMGLSQHKFALPQRRPHLDLTDPSAGHVQPGGVPVVPSGGSMVSEVRGEARER